MTTIYWFLGATCFILSSPPLSRWRILLFQSQASLTLVLNGSWQPTFSSLQSEFHLMELAQSLLETQIYADHCPPIQDVLQIDSRPWTLYSLFLPLSTYLFKSSYFASLTTLQNTLVALTTFLGCLSCINVTKECYQIGKANLVTLVSVHLFCYIPGISITYNATKELRTCRSVRSRQQHTSPEMLIYKFSEKTILF